MNKEKATRLYTMDVRKVARFEKKTRRKYKPWDLKRKI